MIDAFEVMTNIPLPDISANVAIVSLVWLSSTPALVGDFNGFATVIFH